MNESCSSLLLSSLGNDLGVSLEKECPSLRVQQSCPDTAGAQYIFI